MKAYFLFAVLILNGWQFCLALEPVDYSKITPREIAQTAAHLDSLLHDAEEKTLTVQNAYDSSQSALQKVTLENEKLKTSLHESNAERDVVLIAWAIFVALYVGTMFAGEIMRDFPTPWNLIATALCYATIGLTAYGLGRVTLASIAHLIP